MSTSAIRPVRQASISRDPWMVDARSFLRPASFRGGGSITFDDGTHAIAGRELAGPHAVEPIKASA